MRADERVFYIDDDGVARLADEDLAVTIYFQSQGELWDFKEWLEGEGSESFARYRDSGRKYPEICYNCKWFDHNNFQCFDGHGQYEQKENCEGFREYGQEDDA